MIIGYEQIHRIQKHIGWGMMPEEGVKYNLYEAKNEVMLILILKLVLELIEEQSSIIGMNMSKD